MSPFFLFFPGKQFSRIAPFAVICNQHICSHGLSKTARPAHANKLLRRIHHAITILNKSRFIHIYFRIYRSLERLIPRIQIIPHAVTHLPDIKKSVILLSSRENFSPPHVPSITDFFIQHNQFLVFFLTLSSPNSIILFTYCYTLSLFHI